ncbi:MAG: VCBS repeat-containing protein [Candidatus Binatia bacterium]
MIGGQVDGGVLQFAYNDGSGNFPGAESTFLVHDATAGALVVVDFDNDGQQDVALANDDGTLTILVSSEPPATPTPTSTPTATPTGTATPSSTTSATTTDRHALADALPDRASTNTPTPTRTGTATATGSPTNTRGGIVLGGCAIADSGSSSPLQMGISPRCSRAPPLAARRAGALRSRDAPSPRRAVRPLLLVLTLLAAGSAAAQSSRPTSAARRAVLQPGHQRQRLPGRWRRLPERRSLA